MENRYYEILNQPLVIISLQNAYRVTVIFITTYNNNINNYSKRKYDQTSISKT